MDRVSGGDDGGSPRRDQHDRCLTDVLGVEPARLASIIAHLAARRLTVATAESLTGGLLAAALTEVPGSSAVVRGGIICYATELKSQLVGVDRDLLQAAGPVDRQVARQLATGARRQCGADIGLGLTGVAGPDRQGDVPVGTVYVALAGPDDLDKVVSLPKGLRSVTRSQVRTQACLAALELLEGAVLWARTSPKR